MSPGAPTPRTSWLRMTFIGALLSDRVREQGHLPGVLDGGGDVALVLGAVPGDPAGADLAPVAHELAQQVDVLVVDVVLLLGAELAELALGLSLEGALGHAPAFLAQNGGSSLNWPPLLAPAVLPAQSPPPEPPRLARSTLAVANFRLGPISSASTSVTERFSPSGVSQERVRSRPTTMQRAPFCRVPAAFSACWRHTLIRKKEVSPSFQESPSRTRGVTASRKLATAAPLGVKRSSGSSVRLPTSITWLSFATCGVPPLASRAGARPGTNQYSGPHGPAGKETPVRRPGAG